jgi:homocitrate synthase
MARMIVSDRGYVSNKYNLKTLKDIEELVASTVQINIPFNNYITGFCAFSHKAGIHTKAVLNSPSTYESIDPADFGMKRRIAYASRLTGWNTIKSRAETLELFMTDGQYKECTTGIKAIADIRRVSIEEIDSFIHAFYDAQALCTPVDNAVKG